MQKFEKALAKARGERKQGRAEIHDDEESRWDQPADPPAPDPDAPDAPALTLLQEASPPAAPYNGSIVALDYRNPTADSFRILRTQVLKALERLEGTVLGVCSANAGEGKTFVACNLAASIALSQEQPVLLIDLDLRRPSVHSAFELDPNPGVTGYLAGRVRLDECIRTTALDSLQILPGGRPIRNSSEALGSWDLTQAFESLKKALPRRIVVCDVPPLLPSDDALMFSSHLDGAVLVVQEGRTRPGEIQRSLGLLQATSVIGTVLNRSKFNNRFPYSAYGH